MKNSRMLLITLTDPKEDEWHKLKVIFQVTDDAYHAVAYKYMDNPFVQCEDQEIKPYIESEWNNDRTTATVFDESDPIFMDAVIDNI